jgi:hypothetical protein
MDQRKRKKNSPANKTKIRKTIPQDNENGRKRRKYSKKQNKKGWIKREAKLT